MGIYERDYYRREGPSFLASFGNRGRVCKYLIIANVILFALQIVTQPEERAIRNDSGFVTDTLILSPEAVLGGQVWRLLSYAFLHAVSSPSHILFNMLFLWWFGSEVEDRYGAQEFLAFYLVAAFVGGVSFLAWSHFMGQDNPCLGASGAVTAVMVAYACHYPTRVIYVMLLIPVPIWLFVGFQVAQDLFAFAGSIKGIHTTTAVTVHLAGAGFAFAYYKFDWHLLRFWPGLGAWNRNRRARSRFRVYREEERVERPRTPVGVAAPPRASNLDEQLEAKLDVVLQKVSQHGKESLTDVEKDILLRASEVFKKRRS